VTRDYKSSRGGRDGGLSGAAGFLLGLAIGLGVALGVFIYDRRPSVAVAEKPSPAKPGAPTGEEEAAADPGQQYGFYEMLPKFEVVVPEREKGQPTGAPPKPVEKPGTYVLQVGSYSKHADADRVRAQLALQGIESRIHQVSVNDVVRHRVWVGPTTDLALLNRTRDQLRAAGRDVILLTMRE